MLVKGCHRSQRAYSKSFTTKRKRIATESALQVLTLLVLKPDCCGMTIKYHGCWAPEFLASLFASWDELRIRNAINNSQELRFLCIKPLMKAWRNRQPALSDVGKVLRNAGSYQIKFLWSLLVPLYQLICLGYLLSYAMSINSKSC